MSFLPGSTAGVPAVTPKNLVFNMAQAAGNYTLGTATNGDVWVEIIGCYVKTAAVGLTSVTVVTDHTTPKTLVASILLAALTLDSIQTVAIASFLLPSTKRIQGTIVGTGSGGEMDLYVRWAPMTSGATLV